MNFKQLLFIYLLGILSGLALVPFAKDNPQTAIISPITFTLAQEANYLSPLADNGLVLGVEDKKNIKENGFDSIISQAENRLLATSTPSASIVPSPVALPLVNISSNYQGKVVIAAVGDSMTDLMGPELDYLKKKLQTFYPKVDFVMYNYGVGAQNIEVVMERIKGDYDYQGRHYQALANIKPDFVIVESCAYNPFPNSEGGLERQWMALSKITDWVKANTKATIIILATIAPAKEQFGQGPAGINWGKEIAIPHAQSINRYLENALNFAKAAQYYYIDAYHPSLLSNGEGNPAYINPGDHIHQNVAGNEFIASLLAQRIKSLINQ